VVTNVITNGGDFIDFRNTYVADVNVKTALLIIVQPLEFFFKLMLHLGYLGQV
jgi:hypothetical protein